MTKSTKKKQKKYTSPDKVLVFVKRIAYIFTLLVCGVFVGSNIFASATLPPLFVRLSTGVAGSDIQILSQSKDTKQFAELSPEIRTILSKYHQEIYQDITDRKEKIQYLLSLLEAHPKSPEVLYGLYLLSLADKDTLRARTYLQMAREIDPHVGR